MPYIAIPSKAALLVRVQIEERGDVFTATSPDLQIIITGHNLGEEFHAAIKQAIRENFAQMGQTPPMAVIRVSHPVRDTGFWHFAAIPQSILEEAKDAEEKAEKVTSAAPLHSEN